VQQGLLNALPDGRLVIGWRGGMPLSAAAKASHEGMTVRGVAHDDPPTSVPPILG
jgi:hypothetical protein